MLAASQTSVPKAASGHTFFCDQYYDGVPTVQEWLTASIVVARKREEMSNGDLDDLCGFGVERASDKLPLPKSAQFEKNPKLMNSLAFSLASAALNLTLENAIRKQLSVSQKREVLAYIKTHRLGVWSCGSPGPGSGSLLGRAEMFAQFKALEEVDWFVMNH